MRACIYPGTFDPITNGHLDIITRASKIFDRVIVAVAKSESKRPMFGLKSRIKMAKSAIAGIKGAEVMGFENLLVDFAKENGINFVIRGLRAVSDYEYELQLGYANATLWDELETIYFMPSLKNAFISSTVVRAIITHGGEISHLVPPSVLEILKKELS